MKNFVQTGDVVTFIAPSGGVTSGVPVVIGALVLVPAFSAAVTYECEGAVTGCFELPKKSTDVVTQFAKAYWDATNKEVTITATDNTLIGVFMDPLAAGTTKANVRLNGVGV